MIALVLPMKCFYKSLCSGAVIGSVCIALLGANAVANAGEATIVGSALYRERISLPSDVEFDATLEESSHADAKAEVIGRVRLATPGQPPIKFAIPYNLARINPAYRYTVRAKIVQGSQPLFVADAVNVLMTDDKTNVVLILRKAASTTPTQRATSELENTYWKLAQLGEQAFTVGDGQREPYMILQPTKNRIVGYSGCNSLSNTYRLKGNSIAFLPNAATLIACPKNANVESEFHRVLSKAVRWAVVGQRLELFDAKGQSLAQFESRYQK